MKNRFKRPFAYLEQSSISTDMPAADVGHGPFFDEDMLVGVGLGLEKVLRVVSERPARLSG